MDILTEVQIATLVVLVLYTTCTLYMAYQTKRLADAEDRRQEERIKPMLTVVCPERETGCPSRRWSIVNVGQGFALCPEGKWYSPTDSVPIVLSETLIQPGCSVVIPRPQHENWHSIKLRYQGARQEWHLAVLERGEDMRLTWKGPLPKQPEI